MIDNKKDIDLLVQKIQKMNLVEKLIKKREGSSWKFYEFIYVRFDVYEMDSPIGAGIELPQHLLTGSNQKYLIKYNEYDDKLCFWRCLAFCFDVKENPKKDPRKEANETHSRMWCADLRSAIVGDNVQVRDL